MKKYISIIGPTASGKSALALELARALNGELINCDSVQIYQGFDIGAAKPSLAELREIPHHLIDILNGSEDYDARAFARDAEEKITDIRNRNKTPIVVGGTGLYLRALWQDGFHDLPKSPELRETLKDLNTDQLRLKLDQLDPERSREIHGNDRFRLQRAVEIATLLGHSVKDLPPPASKRDESFVIYLQTDRKVLAERIARRSQIMLDQGLIDEVKQLLAQGISEKAKPMQSIGYYEVIQSINQIFTKEDLLEKITIATRQYAKRQETLFRKIPKDFIWNQDSSLDELIQSAKDHLGLNR
ncbi:MAG: tRNA (adenosine(37)-N6)-dimethylallyltransferase MiaA [Proteobacteria bacterium]|nr:MAG: tRNA (adenosine(37)-N6)-dimethylallyltransferase MiaA [Pseudomonadota bacterium]